MLACWHVATERVDACLNLSRAEFPRVVFGFGVFAGMNCISVPVQKEACCALECRVSDSVFELFQHDYVLCCTHGVPACRVVFEHV